MIFCKLEHLLENKNTTLGRTARTVATAGRRGGRGAGSERGQVRVPHAREPSTDPPPHVGPRVARHPAWLRGLCHVGTQATMRVYVSVHVSGENSRRGPSAR